MDPVTALQLFEAVAHLDSAAGWITSNSSGIATLPMLLPAAGADELFAQPRTLLAGGWFPENGKVGVLVKQGLEELGIGVNLSVPDRTTSIRMPISLAIGHRPSGIHPDDRGAGADPATCGRWSGG